LYIPHLRKNGGGGVPLPFQLFLPSFPLSRYKESAFIRFIRRGAIMQRSLSSLLNLYNPNDPLEKAWTIPSPWYFDPGIARLEQESVFANTWQVAGRLDQVAGKGDFFTADLAGEPIVVARGDHNLLRAFYNVWRPHAAALVTALQGRAQPIR